MNGTSDAFEEMLSYLFLNFEKREKFIGVAGDNTYKEFLQKKIVGTVDMGFRISMEAVNHILFPFQTAIVVWAVKKGKAAIFSECGTGKTFMQLEWARLVAEHTNGRIIVVCPLAVAHQTVGEGMKLGITVKYCRHQSEVGDHKIVATNYEMLKEFDASKFVGVVLDESSCLKYYTGVMKRFIIESFRDTRFKLACTATPAPNDHLELGNHAEFLNVMRSNEMISRWFINNSMHAGDYRLKAHAEEDFWHWVSSWAVCLSKPSDLGEQYDDSLFNLPPLEIVNHRVSVDHTRAHKHGELFLNQAQSATRIWGEKKATAKDRVNKAVEIVNSDGYKGSPWVIWCDTNYEADLLKAGFPDAVEVRGSDSIREKEDRLKAFGEGHVKKIITKAEIAGWGLNWQHCSNHVFVGINFSFEKSYQALRRSWRFRQKNTVHAHMIYTESEGNIIDTLTRKQEAHRNMQEKMNGAMRKYGLAHEDSHLGLENVKEETFKENNWTLYQGDCITVIKSIPDNSIHFTIFSPPFKDLYIYSNSVADMGNSASDEEFFQHFGYLVPEIKRVTFPGRLCAVHCKDLPLYMNRDGAAGLYDFPGKVIRLFEQYGWVFHSRITIWKDPVTEMQRTKNHGLLHKNFVSRGEVCRQGMADYVVVFRKWTDDVPDKQIRHDLEPGEYIGTDPPQYWEDKVDHSIQVWQKYASPVWFDINQMNVLNGRQAGDPEDEKHICPLQLEVIERCVWLWSNPGDVIFDPFAGIGSTGWVSLKMKRQFIGVELKPGYASVAVKNLKYAAQKEQMNMFE